MSAFAERERCYGGIIHNYVTIYLPSICQQVNLRIKNRWQQKVLWKCEIIYENVFVYHNLWFNLPVFDLYLTPQEYLLKYKLNDKGLDFWGWKILCKVTVCKNI